MLAGSYLGAAYPGGLVVTTSGTTEVTKTLDARWATRAAVSDAVDVRWPVRASVTDQVDARWQTRAAVADTLDVRWPTRSAVAGTTGLRWPVRAAVSKAVDVRWATRSTVTDQVDARWVVRSAVTDPVDIRWAARSAITDTLDARWAVRGVASAAADVQWQVRKVVARTVDLRWQVASNARPLRDITVTASIGEPRWRASLVDPRGITMRAIRSDSTEYLNVALASPDDISGDVVELSFDRGVTWHTAEHVTGYGVRTLVGPLNGGIPLSVGFTEVLIRVTDTPEVPVIPAGTIAVTA